MQQYFEGRKKFNISSDGYVDPKTSKFIFHKKEHHDYYFANIRWDQKLDIDSMKLSNCTFARMGMKGSKISTTNMHHSVFIDCYMKNAVFQGVDFTGCMFINCMFEKVTFINCEFQFVTFEKCFIPFEAMKANLPKNKYNLTRDLCRNLGLEALRMGDAEEFRKYYFAEKAANEKHYWKCFYHGTEGADKYYHDKYNFWGQMKGLTHFILSKLNKYLWGYGEKNSRLLINMVIIIIGFALEYLLIPVQIFENNETTALGFTECLYISLCNFFTVGPVSQYEFVTNKLYEFSSVAETGLGVMMMGFFVAGIFRYINRRS